MATLKERGDRHDREIAAIRKLIHVGMKMLVTNEKAIRELAVQQRETSRELQAFIRSLRRGGNGHTRSRTIH
jgi:Xaa-Pro aminopeptidase